MAENFKSNAKRRAQQMSERAQRERQEEMVKRRMILAREGTLLYQGGKYQEAMDRFARYFGIVEDWKGVTSGTLHPSHFDGKKDSAELLLITGIYWDISRLYDRSKRKESEVQLKKYLDCFVLFSKGMPYQHLCSEMLRKYLTQDKPVHRGPFKDAYAALGGGKCFIASSVNEWADPATLGRLRGLRDQVLLPNRLGRVLVRIYYGLGPIAAGVMRRMPVFTQKILARQIDSLARVLT